MFEGFRSLPKFSKWSIVRDTSFYKRHSHHEGHEDQITEMATNQNIFSFFVLFVCFVVISSFDWLQLCRAVPLR
jgi:hypothetical protein